MPVQLYRQCMFCESSDGATNEVCNYHYMTLQNVDEFNEYCKKWNEMEKARQKLLKKVCTQ